MAIAPDLGEFDYVLEQDRKLPLEEQTVFRLKPLTFAQRAEVEKVEWKQQADTEEVHLVSDRMGLARKILQCALVGWENFKRQDGSRIEFRRVDEGGRQILPSEMLDLIVPWAMELANAVTKRSTVSEETAKNSGSP